MPKKIKKLSEKGFVEKNEGNESKKSYKPPKKVESVSVDIPLWEFDFSWFVHLHKDNMKEKYKPGDVVVYTGNVIENLVGKRFKVLAANRQDAEDVEYCLENFPYLVYENEIRLASEEDMKK